MDDSSGTQRRLENLTTEEREKILTSQSRARLHKSLLNQKGSVVPRSDSTWIRPTPVSISALWTNAVQPYCDKSASEEKKKHTYRPCNHTWVLRSHPTIQYSGAFCSKCDMENW